MVGDFPTLQTCFSCVSIFYVVLRGYSDKIRFNLNSCGLISKRDGGSRYSPYGNILWTCHRFQMIY